MPKKNKLSKDGLKAATQIAAAMAGAGAYAAMKADELAEYACLVAEEIYKVDLDGDGSAGVPDEP